MTSIYVLKHPTTKEVRYVGKTTNPRVRLYNHIHLANKGRTHCKSWIKSLLVQGLKPEMEIIESRVLLINVADREKYWIRYYFEKGADLCNHTIGGECGLISNDHIRRRENLVLAAIKIVLEGGTVANAEKENCLPNGYLSKVRLKEIDFLKHIDVPYFRKLKRNNPIDKG